MTTHRVTDADLERWVERGLISAQQREAIALDLEAEQPAEGALTLTTLLYYSGGLLVLLAYGIFLGFRWEELDQGGRIAISAASIVFYAVASQLLLRSGRYQLPGELLQMVTVAIVPLFAFALLDGAGWWPEELEFPYSRVDEEAYQRDFGWARMALAGSSLLVALAAFWWSRSPFMLAAGVASFASLAVDASLQVQTARTYYDWHAAQSLAVAAVGASSFVAGVVFRGRTARDYALWFYVMGLVGLAVGLGSQMFPDGPGWGALWMATAVLVLGLSIPLQERLLAAAGLAGVFAYLAKLVFSVFEDANAALGFALLGLLVLGAGMLYQRLTERAFSRPEGGKPAA